MGERDWNLEQLLLRRPGKQFGNAGQNASAIELTPLASPHRRTLQQRAALPRSGVLTPAAGKRIIRGSPRREPSRNITSFFREIRRICLTGAVWPTPKR